MKFVLDTNTLQTIALFEQLTGARVRDCIPSEEQIIFIVHEGEVAKAVGRGGQHVRNMEYKLKKRIKVVEYNPDLLQFVRNVVAPLDLESVKMDENATVFMSAKDLKTRGLLIGRSASNLRLFEGIVQRYFPIKEMRVV